MIGRFSLMVLFMAAGLSGCATVSEERIARLELVVENVQAQEIRLAVLEDAVLSRSGVAHGVQRGQQSAPAVPPGSGTRAAAYTSSTQSPSGSENSTTPQVKALVSPTSAAPSVGRNASAQAAQSYQKALATLESGRPQAASAMLSDFLRAYPGHSLTPNAIYWLGECYYSQKKYDTAVITFKDVVAQFPAHAKSAAAMLKAGYSYALLGDNANARFYMETLIKDYPSSAPASLARTRLLSM